MVVQALYVDPRGPYPALLGPESCWDITRDARLYDGPEAVVAHPDCGPWGRLRHLCRRQTHDCAIRAVEQVRRFGGVLEHPANSRLWLDGPTCSGTRHCAHCEDGDGQCCTCGWEHLPLVDHADDSHGGFSVEVSQVEWGHVARKKTWLYIVGVPRAEVDRLIAERPMPGRQPTHWVSGGGSGRGKAPPGIKVCSKQQRNRTPLAFAEFLIAIARLAEKSKPE